MNAKSSGRPSPKPKRSAGYRQELVLAAIGLAIFLAFAGYAVLAQPVYKATAALRLAPAVEASNQGVSPQQQARRLQDVLVNRGEGASTSPAASMSALPSVAADALEVTSADGGTLQVSFKDSDAARAREICNRLAARAAELSPQLFSRSAQVVTGPTIPTLRIEPDRGRILTFGLLTAIGAAGVIALAHGRWQVFRAKRKHRPKVERPRSVAGVALARPDPARIEGSEQVALEPRRRVTADTRVVEALPNFDRSADDSSSTLATTVADQLASLQAPELARRASIAKRRIAPYDPVTLVFGSPLDAEKAGPERGEVDFAATLPLELPRLLAPADQITAAKAQPSAAIAVVARRKAPSGPTARVRALEVSHPFQPDPGLSPTSRSELRDGLLRMVGDIGFATAVVGSAESGLRKSRLTAELALALSASNQCRLLLLEADLRNPSVQRWLRVDVPLAAGFSLQLQVLGRDPAEEPWTVLRCSPGLDLLAESSLRSPEALLSSDFVPSVSALKRLYDLVLIDGPLLTEEEDCRALDAAVDGVIVVTDGRPSSAIRELLEVFSPKRFSTIL